MATPAIQLYDRIEGDPRRGFGSHADFLRAVIRDSHANSREDVRDVRLKTCCTRDPNDHSAGDLAFLLPRAFGPHGIRAAAGSDEQGVYADPYGGFAVPTATADYALGAVSADPTAGRTRIVPMDEPVFKIPARADKDHSTSLTGGLTFSRQPETIDIPSSRMQFEMVTLHAATLAGLAFASEELLSSSPSGFAAIIGAGFNDELGGALLREKLFGKGVGEFLGAFHSPAKIAVAKESGQAADTIVFQNVVKMRARCWGYSRAIWIGNSNTYPQLATLSIAVGTGGSTAALYHHAEVEGAPDMLSGRPIFYSEHCPALGDAGDLILVDWSQFLEGIYQPLESAESIHVRFVQHERALKFWIRNAGAPWWRSALTPENGADTLSPIVTLEERA